MAEWLGQLLSDAPLIVIVLVLVLIVIISGVTSLLYWDGGSILEHWRKKRRKRDGKK